MKYSLLLVPIVGMAAATTPASSADVKARADPDDLMIFVCDQMPEVCKNMCYGAYCLDIGTSLHYDKASASEKRNRRKAAGCIASGGNRCSTKKGHDSGTTANGNVATRVNRCVPAGENRKQGGVINAFYKKTSYCNGGPCSFDVEFSNAGDIDYCEATSSSDSQCQTHDDNEVPGPGTGSAGDGDEAGDGTDDDGGNPEPQKRSVARRYRTSSGLEISIKRGAVLGQRAVTVLPRNATLWEEQARSDVFDSEDGDDEYDYMLDNLEVREDTIVEEIL
ncbi:hypothetical protein B0J12DRAFT_696327 [Macrophomina phaseolina]|uniref:Deoxyribonuclease NucA/NucB domain-containing protein n=1 Tax=Macrophomina phaseolina TaxID=35725 RepID=A0ABQ8GJQ9_9PEZI|nr:hypothetical protein B0J12DRAFT_696327 [Macrophomina phaseolina]